MRQEKMIDLQLRDNPLVAAPYDLIANFRDSLRKAVEQLGA